MSLLTVCGGTKTNEVSFMAHRGYSAKYPENTALAFAEAAKHGAAGVETDLRVTKDGVYVLSHNDEIVFSDGTKMTVSENSFEELTAKPLKNKKTKDEVYLCSLDEFLGVMKEYGLEFYIEFKVECTEALATGVFNEVKEKYDISKCIFESPNFEKAALVRGLFPEMPVMYVVSSRDENLDKCFENSISADIQYYEITEETVEAFHSRGLKVGAWTCDNYFSIAYAKSLGVDYIESNNHCR